MGLFNKKYCDVCGEKIGLLGNRKLADGNMCRACAAKLSPWFSDRRESTLEEINKQLEYREANKAAVHAFHVTRSLGEYNMVLLDENAGKFMVTGDIDFKDANPDVLDISQVTGCSTETSEFREEIKREGPNGEQVSCNPPRYNYRYDYYTTIRVDSPWFDEMRFRLNRSSVEVQSQGGGFFGDSGPQCSDVMCRQYVKMGDEIKDALFKARDGAGQNAAAGAAKPAATAAEAAPAAPRISVVCPYCGATTVPDAGGRCEFCGGPCR